MITNHQKVLSEESPSWQRELSQAVRSVEELLRLCGLDAAQHKLCDEACAQFPVMVPRGLLKRIEPGNPEDPILLQVLPQARETQLAAGYTPDPLLEADFTPVPGLLHKYPSRVLLIASGGCAINCRYCFRRHFPYGEHRNQIAAWVAYLEAHKEVHEVILSGGDPLLCSDQQLAEWLGALQEIEHIDSLRIHSRIPVVLPDRITPELIAVFKQLHKPITLVLHSNCAAEIDQSVLRALKRLHQAGVVLLNQSVLLKGVNDSAAALRDLSLSLQRARVLPYYLFLLDAVQGSAHFEVSETTALALHSELCRQLPRYLVPRLAREIAGELHKQVLAG